MIKDLHERSGCKHVHDVLTFSSIDYLKVLSKFAQNLNASDESEENDHHIVKNLIAVVSGQEGFNDYSNQFEQTPFILASLKTTP